MLGFIIGAVLGFIAGALTFRNNKAKAEALVDKAESAADKVKSKLG